MTKQKRSSASYEPTWDRFTKFPPTLIQPYDNQYNTCYNVRLSMLRDRCLASANSKVPVVSRIIELAEDTLSTVVGTIVKSTPGRPVLDTAYHSSYEGMSYLGVPYADEESFRNYCNENDTIVLEDESGRVELNDEKVDVGCLATGAVVALEGVVDGTTGIMNVKEVYFPAMGPQDDLDDSEVEDDVNILLLSGLECGGTDSTSSLQRELLVDYLTGHFATQEGSNIARVIVAGGGCTKPIKPENSSPFGNWNTNKKKSDQDTSNVTLPIRELDLFLSELCASGIPVDYIPGLHDPTNANWPQKPLHPCLLSNSECFVNMLSRAPNPYEAKIGGRSFLGSDGLNISDLRRFVAKQITSGHEDQVDDEGNAIEPTVEMKEMTSLETLECALRCNHLAPTGPDSLPTFPFNENDPFVMVNTPHVFFAGNCDEFETKSLEKDDTTTRLICIPSFAMTGQAVLLKLNTMDCTVIEFGGAPNLIAQHGDEKKMEE